MKTLSIFFILMALLMGTGCTTTDTAVEVAAPPLADAPEATPPHPVSFEALMAKDFDGREFTVGEVLASEDAYTRYAITYRSGELLISGIMNVPRGDGPFPVLFLNHGYIDPAIYTTGRGLRREQDYFARQGFVIIHSDYRNHAGSDDDPNYRTTLRLGYVEDVINAVKAVQAAKLPYIDTEHIGMLGHSMGGGIAQGLAVVEPELVDAIVLYAPVAGNAWANYERYTVDRPDEAQIILDLYGSAQDNPDFWAGASSENYYDLLTAPVMIHIGTNDESTPPEWSYAIAGKLEELDKDVTLHVYEGETHEFGPQWATMMERSVQFFQSKL
jgi:dipeptidyl aminopeptidase/acylaminoacyl peptidase